MRGIEDNPTENVSQLLVCGRHHITHLGGDPIEKDGGAACSGLFSTGTKKLSVWTRRKSSCRRRGNMALYEVPFGSLRYWVFQRSKWTRRC